MKAKLFLLATLCIGLVFVAQSLTGCGRADRTRTPPRTQPAVAPAPPEPIDTDPEKVLAQLKGSVHAKLDCSDCHAPAKGGAKAGEVGKGQCTSCHKVEAAAYVESIHAVAIKEKQEEAATCEACHGQHDTRRVDDPKSRVSQRNTAKTCGKCHENPELAKKLGIEEPLAARNYLESIHGQKLMAIGLVVAPTCADCHGRAHHIFKANDPRSSVNRYNVANTCGQCHAGPREKWLGGIHAQKLEEEAKKKGITVDTKPLPPRNGNGNHAAADKAADEAAAEVDPDIGPAASAAPAAPAPAPAPAKAPPETTEDKVAKKDKPPTCPDCHSAHSIIEPGPRFQLASDRICGDCHEDRLDRYLETYHGRAHDLGDPDVAACHDCHGQHDIWPSKDARSTLSVQHKLGTCQKCHVSAPAKFADYRAHADHSDKKNYPTLYWTFMAMTGLLVGTFGFFGIHSLLWLMRTLIVRFRDPVKFKQEKALVRKEEGARLYRRFRPIDRFVHFLVIVSFMLLVITGMPLKFHTKPWAHYFFDQIGGAAVAASVHRFAAIVTLTYFVLHIGSLIVLLRRNREKYSDSEGRLSVRKLLALAFGPDSPFPRLQDVKDILAHMKWFFARGPKPKFDRFTYWEKFDYMAVFWGVTVIGLSGLVMWFPETVTRFLPGISINIAHIIHSDEALLAAGFIFTFHFFNSHFRPEKFPYDQVMFSGKVTEEELKHERPAQYERMKESGELEEFTSLGEWAQWKLIINIFGAAAIVLGLALAAAIFWALI